MFLPLNNIPNGPVYHRGVHTNIYYSEVERLLLGAKSRNDLIRILHKIAEDLLNGIFPH